MAATGLQRSRPAVQPFPPSAQSEKCATGSG